MRLAITVLGRRLLEVTMPEATVAPSVESNVGGQFELGFSALRDGEVTCGQPGRNSYQRGR